MKQELKKYPKMKLVSTVYGNDDPTTATQVTQGLLQQYPNLKGIISPTTVGIAAAAAVLDTAKYRGKIALTGLGTPDEMKKYVADGTVKQFVLWNPATSATSPPTRRSRSPPARSPARRASTFTAGKLGCYTVGADNTVLLGPPSVFDSANINQLQLLATSTTGGDPAACPAGRHYPAGRASAGPGQPSVTPQLGRARQGASWNGSSIGVASGSSPCHKARTCWPQIRE